ncbi:MAG: Holliday junction resolvase RuvX [Acidimicrobiaceae bacterium]|nr:Holliday junction resolvase RuvX [Acidimicrobiaceae bacterium]
MTAAAGGRSEGKGAIPAGGRVLGIDLGAKRVGVAVSDGDQRLAMPATTLVRSGDRPREHRALVELAREYEAVGVVFGLPLSLSGAEGRAAAGARAEAEQVASLLAVPVDLVDERLTTVEAAGALRAAGHPTRRQRQVIDQVAAAVLLQSWLDRRAGQREAGGGDPAGRETAAPRTAEMERPGT